MSELVQDDIEYPLVPSIPQEDQGNAVAKIRTQLRRLSSDTAAELGMEQNPEWALNLLHAAVLEKTDEAWGCSFFDAPGNAVGLFLWD